MSVEFAADVLSGLIFFGVVYAFYRYNPKLKAKVDALLGKNKK